LSNSNHFLKRRVVFPQVDVNAVLLVAERFDLEAGDPANAMLRFVNLRTPITEIAAEKGTRSNRMVGIVEFVLSQSFSYEDDRIRVKTVSLLDEKTELATKPTTPRNWSKYLRAPLSYHALFGSAA
jgi:hypothetical protein